jgi:26S proteasome regulatory subunit T4
MSNISKQDSLIRTWRKRRAELTKLEEQVQQLNQQITVLREKFDESERQFSSLHSTDQIMGEVLCPLGEERYIVKTISGTRYVVGM